MASVSWLQICQPQRSQALTGMSARQEMRPRSVSCRSAIRRLLFLMRPILQKSQHFSFCEFTIFFPPLVSYVSKLVFPRLLAGMCEIVHTAATTSSAASGTSAASMKSTAGPRLVLGAALSRQAREPAHRQSRGVTGSGEGAIRGVLAQVEGVGQAGRGALASGRAQCNSRPARAVR